MSVNFGLMTGELVDSKDEFLQVLHAAEMVTVELLDETDPEVTASKAFSWTILDYSENEMQIKLDFEEPLQISSTLTLDLISVTFVDTSFIFDKQGMHLEAMTHLSGLIPTQYASEEERALIESLFDMISGYQT